MRLRTRLLATLAAAGVATAGLVGVQAEPSQAAPRDGICDPGELCYYYNSNYGGAVSDFPSGYHLHPQHAGSIASYGNTQPSCYEYKDDPRQPGISPGTGRCVKNDAASVWNRTPFMVRIYYNSNYAGPYVELAPGAKANLADLRSTPAGTNLKNNNASHGYFRV
ncbi:MAG: peptidase inhibitor family I36 protein [Micrococcales bacterium]|nr:peptidase inhibitor family I36 protein [Micrococcales bacterium]